MQNFKSLSQRIGLSGISLVFVCLLILGVSAFTYKDRFKQENSQAQDKVVEHVSVPNQPVQILNTNLLGKSFKLGEKIDGDDDWLKSLSLKVKNVSNKPITYIGMYYTFPETKASGNMMVFPVRYGQNKRIAIVTDEPKLLMPGDAVDMALSAAQYAKLKSFIERRHQLINIHKIKVELVEIHFEDGTVWNGGNLYRIDANNPQKLIPLSNSSTSKN
ncbi:MAG: hypothetical protein WBP93_06810 [Pyrinomonadaceae bacterium]